MKTLTTILIGLFVMSLTSKASPEALETTQEQTVLICTGKYAKKYHKKMCKGMNACKDDKQEISLSKAKSKNLTACKICY